MTNKKWSEKDYNLWLYLYVDEKKSIGDISKLLNVPKSTVRIQLNKKKVMRSNSESKKKRIPWNKGKTGLQTAWNKGMKNSYPYPSPFKGKISKSKGVPRSSETIEKIRKSKLKSLFNGFTFYKGQKHKLDTLYLVTLEFKGNLYLKIGRTFKSIEDRYRVQSEVSPTLKVIHKKWHALHQEVVQLEYLVLQKFSDYSLNLKHTFFKGHSECFTSNLPFFTVIDFVDGLEINCFNCSTKSEKLFDMVISSQAEGTPLEGSETTGELECS